MYIRNGSANDNDIQRHNISMGEEYFIPQIFITVYSVRALYSDCTLFKVIVLGLGYWLECGSGLVAI